MIYSYADILKLHSYFLKASTTEQIIVYLAIFLIFVTYLLKLIFRKTNALSKRTKKIFSCIYTVEIIILIISGIGIFSIHEENFSSHALHDYRVIYVRMHHRTDYHLEKQNIRLSKRLHTQFHRYSKEHHGHVSQSANSRFHKLNQHYENQINKYGNRITNEKGDEAQESLNDENVIINIKPTRHLEAVSNTARDPLKFWQPAYSIFEK